MVLVTEQHIHPFVKGDGYDWNVAGTSQSISKNQKHRSNMMATMAFPLTCFVLACYQQPFLLLMTFESKFSKP
jgi:hypothetical protein